MMMTLLTSLMLLDPLCLDPLSLITMMEVAIQVDRVVDLQMEEMMVVVVIMDIFQTGGIIIIKEATILMLLFWNP